MPLSGSPLVNILERMTLRTKKHHPGGHPISRISKPQIESVTENPTEQAPTASKKGHVNVPSHSTNIVLTLCYKEIIARWMVDEVQRPGTEKIIRTKEIKCFPQFFLTGNYAD